METRPNPTASAGFMLLAAALIAGTSLLAKMAGRDVLGDALHPLQISHGRFLFAFLAIGTTALILRPRIETPNLSVHFARSLAGWSGISLMFAAVAFIPMADATAISFLNPVFAMILAIPLLGERVGPWRWTAAGIAVIGAMILIRPGAGTFQPAALLALSAALVMGFEITLIKLLTGRERPLQILLINNAIGLAIATLAVLFVWAPPTAAQWGALITLGLMMATAQACFIQAMKRADASFAVPFSYATLIFVGLYDFAVFDVVPAGSSLAGAAIIIAGAALMLWRESRARR
ncbi:DMT family transporter [Aliiroseovarius subalbicans]|uniref:DMT family transporter n=1 Tax=Aliiroseovarius subalbicans TaxID=2925840 RepID=UPI001F593E5A|nr:DMT family transporter [Aliiroseovarius subalbicans]MCI2400382.1 DMT family transporter [Aliiroseovarius subalbicans]